MKSSISFCITIFDFLIATTCRLDKIPLYTIPCPPPPSSRDLSKLLVGFSSSSKVTIILSAISVLWHTNCCSNCPRFCSTNISLSLFFPSFLILRVTYVVPRTVKRKIAALTTPRPIVLRWPTHNTVVSYRTHIKCAMKCFIFKYVSVNISNLTKITSFRDLAVNKT